MQKVACPGCGAEVTFRSAASVMAVCEYCRTAVLKEAAAVRDIGKIAPVFEDYSPLQIGTSGRWEKTAFTLVGRLQLKYGAGYWNEWRALFDDGSEGWLSDASGQYVFTRPRPASQKLPQFTEVRPGAGCTYAGNRYIACDVREARCVAGEGELPFRVGDGWALKAADFRWRDRFLTFDYSESDTPAVYVGQAVTLEALSCQLLRAADDVKDAAGRYRGASVPLNCPSCGNGIQYRVGMANHVVCSSCHAEVDCSGEKAEVLAKHEEVARVATTLRTGDEGRIENVAWTVIGLACHKEVGEDEDSNWVEYLLFNPKQGLSWLVETSDGWSRVKVLDNWPEPDGDNQRLLGDVYRKLFEYVGEVTYAEGNFNWQVQIGDRVTITDYEHRGQRITQEKSGEEITWSLAQATDGSGFLSSFIQSRKGSAVANSPEIEDALARVEAQAQKRAKQNRGARDASFTPDGAGAFASGWPMWAAWILLLLLNFNLLFVEEDDMSFVITAVAAWLVYLPVQIAKKFG